VSHVHKYMSHVQEDRRRVRKSVRPVPNSLCRRVAKLWHVEEVPRPEALAKALELAAECDHLPVFGQDGSQREREGAALVRDRRERGRLQDDFKGLGLLRRRRA
jgi:hypothetical protein